MQQWQQKDQLMGGTNIDSCSIVIYEIQFLSAVLAESVQCLLCFSCSSYQLHNHAENKHTFESNLVDQTC